MRVLNLHCKFFLVIKLLNYQKKKKKSFAKTVKKNYSIEKIDIVFFFLTVTSTSPLTNQRYNNKTLQ